MSLLDALRRRVQARKTSTAEQYWQRVWQIAQSDEDLGEHAVAEIDECMTACGFDLSDLEQHLAAARDLIRVGDISARRRVLAEAHAKAGDTATRLAQEIAQERERQSKQLQEAQEALLAAQGGLTTLNADESEARSRQQQLRQAGCPPQLLKPPPAPASKRPPK